MQLLPHVDHFNRRKFQVNAQARTIRGDAGRTDPACKRQNARLAGFGSPERIHRRRRAAEYDDRALLGAQVLGQRPGMVARLGVLLVRRLVFLIEDDQAEVRDRRE